MSFLGFLFLTLLRRKTLILEVSHQTTVALEQETILGLSGPRPKRLLAPSLIDFRGNPGIRALYQAIGIPTLREEPKISEVENPN